MMTDVESVQCLVQGLPKNCLIMGLHSGEPAWNLKRGPVQRVLFSLKGTLNRVEFLPSGPHRIRNLAQSAIFQRDALQLQGFL